MVLRMCLGGAGKVGEPNMRPYKVTKWARRPLRAFPPIGAGSLNSQFRNILISCNIITLSAYISAHIDFSK